MLTARSSTAPRNLKLFTHARRLRINVTIGANLDQYESDNFYEDRSDPSTRNLLADYLLHDAPFLKSLETNWFPIFRVKQCLPRFACLSLYCTIDQWKLDFRERDGLPADLFDNALQRNVRRLRSALRHRALESRRTKGQTQDAATLTAEEVVAVGEAQPFEEDDIWSTWLSERDLMEEVAKAFNACPWALHDDTPPNPTSQEHSDGVRDSWPLKP
jgi:hypothetical protein